MIFVTAGTVSFPFGRMIDEVMRIYGSGSEKLVVQHGSTPVGKWGKSEHVVKDYYSYSQMINYLEKADVVISACGEASVFLGLEKVNGKLVFVPRQKRYREHVDDQQVEIGQYIERQKLAEVVFDIDSMEMALNRSKINKTTNMRSDHFNRKQLILEMHRLVEKAVWE